MKNIDCWLCGNTMTYKGIVNAEMLGKCYNWECDVCGEGILEKAVYRLNWNCHICNSSYGYREDKELEVSGMILFQCRKCGDRIAVYNNCEALEKAEQDFKEDA